MTDKPSSPVSQGRYIPAKRHGDLVFTAGMTPRKNSVLMVTGQVKLNERIGYYKEAVELATENALKAAHLPLTAQEAIGEILSLTVYISAEGGFTAHSQLADFASEYLAQKLGSAGVSGRAAVGAATLPGNAPVEIQLIATIVSK